MVGQSILAAMMLVAATSSVWATKRVESVRWAHTVSAVLSASLAAGWYVIDYGMVFTSSGVTAAASVDAWEFLSSISWSILLGLVVALAVIDSATYRLPNKIMWPSYFAFASSLSLSWLADQHGEIKVSLIAAGVSGLIFAIFAAISPTGLGWGDVKYVVPVAGAAGWWGLESWGQSALMMAIVGGVFAVGVLMVTRNRRATLPFGPIMLAGAILGVGLTSAIGA